MKSTDEIEQELRAAATRAMAQEHDDLPLNKKSVLHFLQSAAVPSSSVDASERSAGAAGSAQPPGTEETHSIATERVAKDGDASERASQFKDPLAVMQTAPGVQGASSYGRHQEMKHDDLPHNEKRAFQCTAASSSCASSPQGNASLASLRQDAVPAVSDRYSRTSLSTAGRQDDETSAKRKRPAPTAAKESRASSRERTSTPVPEPESRSK